MLSAAAEMVLAVVSGLRSNVSLRVTLPLESAKLGPISIVRVISPTSGTATIREYIPGAGS